MTTSPVERAAQTFAAVLGQWRVDRGMTKKQLAALMGFDPSYVSHVEGRRHRPTEDFARRAEAVLGAGGAIWRTFQEYDELRHSRSTAHRDPPVPEQWMPPGTGLIVDQEIAELAWVDGRYRCLIRRDLYNAGNEPVTRYLVRIAVDRFPQDPEKSNRHHRAYPLTFAELDLQARCEDERMEWRSKQDRDNVKEIWLLFENDRGRFPLYPGERTTIEYRYTVGQEKWGQWFQRAVRLPTRHLTVRLDFPLEFEAQVWGVEDSLAAEAPVRTPLERHADTARTTFEWSTDTPALNARYRLEWRFRGGVAAVADAVADGGRASTRMSAAGIVQRGADLLRQPARQFDLPREEAAARDAAGRLRATLDRLDQLHVFR
jgi:transcriptional regulator with XRE-family HTH domain